MLRFEYQPRFNDPVGVAIEPHHSLVQFGPLIQVVAAIPQALQKTIADAGKVVAAPQVVLALIDTGCTRTSIDKRIISALGVSPTGIATVGTASGLSQAELVPVQLTFPNLAGATITLPQAMTCDLTGQPISILVGRDILRHFVMIYDGQIGRVTFMT
jgi:hypothetical protein